MSFNLGSAHGEIVIDYNGAGVQQAMGDLNALSQQGTNLLRAGAGVTAFGAAIGGALLGATNQAADFQFQMDAVNAALGGLDASQMEVVTQQALDMGAASKFSAGEVAGVQEQLAKSGLSVEEVTGGATQAVLDLAAATGEGLQPATVATAAALNLFQLDATQTADVADILTAALNESSATLPDMQRGINNLGPVFANLNRYAEDGEGALRDTAAAVAYFNSLGLKAADAGLSIARGMTDLATPTSKASEEMAKLGISAFDLQGNMLPLPELMDQLNKGMADMSDQDRIAALSLIFGAEAADVMNDAIKHGGDGLRDYEKNTEAAGQAAEQAKIRQDNLRGSIEQLSGAIQTAAINIGNTFLEPLQGIVEGITNLVNAFNSLPPEIQATIAQFAALIAAMSLLGGGAITAAGAILRFGPAFAAAVAAAAPFLAILAAIGAAIGIGILAYKTDFLGFGTAVNKALKSAQHALRIFGIAFDSVFNAAKANGMNDLSAAVFAFGEALKAATGIDITGATSEAAFAIQALADGWQNAIQNGFNPGAAALGALAAAAASLGLDDVASALYDAQQAAQLFGTTFATVASSARAAGYSDLAADIIAFGNAIENVTGLPVASFFEDLANAVQLFQSKSSEAQAAGINPLIAGLIGLRSVIQSITGLPLVQFFDQLGSAISSAAEGVATFIDTLRAGDIGGALGQIGTAIVDALSGLAVTLTDWVLNVAAPAVMNFIGAASDWILEQLNNLGTTIDNFTDWVLNVGLPAAGEIVGSIAAWLSEKLTGLAITISSFTQWVLDVGLPAAGELIGDLGGWIREKLEGAAIAISDFTGWSLSLGLPGGAGGGGNAVGAGAGLPDLTAFITEKLTAAAIAIENFTGWSLTITTPEGGVQIDTAGIIQAIHDALTVDQSFVDQAGEIGRELGTKLGNALVNGVAEAMSAAATVIGTTSQAHGADASGLGAASLGDAFANFDQEFADSFFDIIWPKIDNIPNLIAQKFNEKGIEWHNQLMQKLGDAFEFLFSGTLIDPASADAAGGTGQQMDATQLGQTMGEAYANSFTSEEFANGFTTGLDTVDSQSFAGIAGALLTKVNEAIGTAMAAKGPGATSETGDGTSPIGGDMGAALVTSLATGLKTSIDSAPVETFAAIGTSLITKIQGAISAAMTTASTQGQQGPVGEGAVGGMGTQLVTGLATSIAAAITAAPIESFAEVGTALSVKLQEVLSTALSAGAGAGRGQGAIGTLGGAQGGGIGTQIAQSIATAISGADFASVATALQTSLGTAVTTAIQQVSTVISTATNVWITTFITTFAAIAQSTLSGMAAVAQSVQAGLSVISTSISTWTNVWITTISTTVAAMQASLDGFASSAAAAGQTAGQGFSDGLTSGMAAAQAAAQAAVDAIIAILNSAAAAATAAGQAVGEGFAAGMEASLGRVQAAAAAMADAAAAGLAAAAQIASPSKVSMALGEQFGQGFQLGIAGAAPAAAKSSYDMGFESIHALADSLRSNADARVTRLRNLGDNIRENQGLASGGGQPTTIETTGTVELDGEQMGTFTVETVLGGLIGAQRKGGKRRGRMQ